MNNVPFEVYLLFWNKTNVRFKNILWVWEIRRIYKLPFRYILGLPPTKIHVWYKIPTNIPVWLSHGWYGCKWEQSPFEVYQRFCFLLPWNSGATRAIRCLMSGFAFMICQGPFLTWPEIMGNRHRESPGTNKIVGLKGIISIPPARPSIRAGYFFLGVAARQSVLTLLLCFPLFLLVEVWV